jgi:hypothetical protein
MDTAEDTPATKGDVRWLMTQVQQACAEIAILRRSERLRDSSASRSSASVQSNGPGRRRPEPPKSTQRTPAPLLVLHVSDQLLLLSYYESHATLTIE